MLKDRTLVWAVEYLIGIALLVTVILFVVHLQTGWSDAHSWAYLLFIACVGFILAGSASAMRQRMQLAERIAKLERVVEGAKPAQKRARNKSGRKRTLSERLIGSVN
jgi:protein-S-isoprenylcysteine O-methyltransferase Ste14